MLHRIYFVASKICITAMWGSYAEIMCRAQPAKLKAEPNVRIRHGPELLNFWTKWGPQCFFIFFPQVGYSDHRFLFRRQMTVSYSFIISCVCSIQSQKCDNHMLVICVKHRGTLGGPLETPDCRLRSDAEGVASTCGARVLHGPPLAAPPLPLAGVKVAAEPVRVGELGRLPKGLGQLVVVVGLAATFLHGLGASTGHFSCIWLV